MIITLSQPLEYLSEGAKISINRIKLKNYSIFEDQLLNQLHNNSYMMFISI